jgi:hypothetical protein
MPFKPAPWPKPSRTASDIMKLYGKPALGLDLEWDLRDRPTVLGISDGEFGVSCNWKEGKPYLVELHRRFPNTIWVGHNFVGADTFVLVKEGIQMLLENSEDTIIRWWLNNMHLCKSSNRAEEDDGGSGGGGSKRGRGFMNLGSMCSVMTNFSYWKECRGEMCEGPCPEHDVFGYNVTDAGAPVIALPQLKRQAMIYGTEDLYKMHRELAYILGEMREFGVAVDVPYVNQLREEFEREKEALYAQLEKIGINPRSGKQVLEFFAARDIQLENNQEQTIREAFEDTGDEVLGLLLDYKELGNGPDRWFAPQYVSDKGYLEGFLAKDGRIHPHLGFFTSSGRLMCAGPNLQNVAKRRINRKTGENVGKKIRKAIVASPGHYLVRADFSNAENRSFVYLAGYEPPSGDFHAWMVANIGIDNSHPFAIAMGSARDAAKSVTHAADYLEGIQLKTANELKTPRIKKEIEFGARLVFPEWTFGGRIITFTGANMAQRAFGSKTLENRKQALDIVTRYMDQFPGIRALQMKITKQIEEQGVCKLPTGYVIKSYGDPHDRMKAAASYWGSNPIAHLSKLALIDIARKRRAGRPMREVLQIHDEILTEVPDSVHPDEAMKWLVQSMELPMDLGVKEMPKPFVCPAEPSYGPNWKDQKEAKKEYGKDEWRQKLGL